MVPDTSSFHKRTKIHSINEQKIFGANPKLVENNAPARSEKTLLVYKNVCTICIEHAQMYTHINKYA